MKDRYLGEPQKYASSDHFCLAPNEEPRKQYEFPTEPFCPHCGERTNLVLRKHFFRCYKCSLLLEKAPDAVMPLTDDMKRQPMRGGKPTIDLFCSHCGQSFRKLVSTQSDMCKRCRDNAANAKWRAANPEKYKAILKKHDDRRARQKMSGSLGEGI